MANTQPAQVGFSVIDELGVRATTSYPAMIDPAMTVAQLVTATNGLGALVDAIIGGKITGARATVELPALGKGAPAAGSRVEQNGVFNFRNGVTTHRFGVAVPSLVDAVIAGNRVDLTDADVMAYFGALTAAITGGGVYTNSARQALTALVDAFISFRKHRRQLLRSSFEEA